MFEKVSGSLKYDSNIFFVHKFKCGSTLYVGLSGVVQGGNTWGGAGGATAPPQLLANNTFLGGFHTPLTERYHQKWC